MKTKLIILIFAMAGLMFAGVQSVNAQTAFSVTVYWVDNACNCGAIQSKYITEMELIELPSTSLWSLTNPINVTSNPNPWEVVNDYAYYETDCHLCYKISATVEYEDSEGLCCKGTGSATVSGSGLYTGDAEVWVYME